MKNTANWKIGFLLAMITTLMWGLLPIALKVVLQAMDPVTITWYRFSVSLLLVGTYLLYKRKIPSVRKFTKRNIFLLSVASLGLAGNYIFYLKGLDYVSPNTAQVVIQLAPVLLFLGGIVVFKESIKGVQWAGVAILFGGLLLFFENRLSSLVSEWRVDFYKGIILIVLAAVTWMTYALAQKAALKDLYSDQILAIIYIVSATLVLPISEPVTLVELNSLQFGFLVFACLNTFVAYGCFAEALNLWEASRVSAVIALAPIFTIFFTKLVLWGDFLDMGSNPDITLVQGIAAGAVVVGSVMVALGSRGKEESAETDEVAKLQLPD